ncbi:hypothetical protein Pcinc_023193 [Petrolisthes cinctipes]|uniref:Uncharacterized protein n=1 Tax=Petrolisthes cinctipes TaxID=88211 RepID=A0AAE1KH65_PETCI|nr:hypothetical protein Pcinc_023193 [Petrolisthes cinctipes]
MSHAIVPCDSPPKDIMAHRVNGALKLVRKEVEMLRPPPSLISEEGGAEPACPPPFTQFAIPPAFPRLRPVRFEPRVIMQATPCGNKNTQTPLTPD